MSVLDTLAGSPTTPPTDREPKTPNGVQAIPYNANWDKDADRFLPWFWERLKADGLVTLYYPGQEETGFAAFVKLMSNAPQTQIALVVPKNVEGLPDGEPIGFVSWEPMTFGSGNGASAGFIFLRKFWDAKHTVDAANAVMKLWFEVLNLDLVIGIVAQENTPALRFLSRIGWQKLGALPGMHTFKGKASDAVLHYVTKEMFEGKR